MIAGILQVFSFLVVPALLGWLCFRTTGRILVMGWIAETLVSSSGIAVSHLLDLPTAPVIVAGLALLFFVSLAVKVFVHRLRSRVTRSSQLRAQLRQEGS